MERVEDYDRRVMETDAELFEAERQAARKRQMQMELERQAQAWEMAQELGPRTDDRK